MITLKYKPRHFVIVFKMDSVFIYLVPIIIVQYNYHGNLKIKN